METKPNQEGATENVASACDGGVIPHAPGMSERDWREDFAHENGCYQCECMFCQQMFYGHKRRRCCRSCSRAV